MRIAANKNGFTLVEVMIVVAVVAILALIAMGSCFKMVADSQAKLCKANQHTLFNAAALYSMFEESSLESAGSATEQITELQDKGYLKRSSDGSCPAGSAEESDYVFIYDASGSVNDVECQVNPGGHKWP